MSPKRLERGIVGRVEETRALWQLEASEGPAVKLFQCEAVTSEPRAVADCAWSETSEGFPKGSEMRFREVLDATQPSRVPKHRGLLRNRLEVPGASGERGRSARNRGRGVLVQPRLRLRGSSSADESWTIREVGSR